MPERSTLTVDNLTGRHKGIMARLGKLAYERRDLQIQMEKIDEDVAQLEGQEAIIKVTLQDAQRESDINQAVDVKEREDAKRERSKRAKKGAATKEARAKTKAQEA